MRVMTNRSDGERRKQAHMASFDDSLKLRRGETSRSSLRRQGEYLFSALVFSIRKDPGTALARPKVRCKTLLVDGFG